MKPLPHLRKSIIILDTQIIPYVDVKNLSKPGLLSSGPLHGLTMYYFPCTKPEIDHFSNEI